DDRFGDDRYTDTRPPGDDRFGGDEPAGARSGSGSGGGDRDVDGADGFGERDEPPVRRPAASGWDVDGWDSDEDAAGRSFRNGGPQ
ncbi:hypothetical protein G3M58_11470, partial [Streptomyces sp. SID7499]|nr:hypothetical protein [Streptomyces sp. SID7499]